jgi:hypothetical protein
MNKEEFVYAIGDMVRFVSEPDVKAVVTGIVMRKGGCSFIVSDKGQEVEVGVEELMGDDEFDPFVNQEGEVVT